MGFWQTVRTVIFKKYFKFTGRATRLEYWWSRLCQVTAIALVFLCLELLVKIFPFCSRGVDLIENLTIFFSTWAIFCCFFI